MKVEIEDISAVRKKMTIEVPVDNVDKAFRSALGRVARKVNIPGFRKGKAPKDVVRQRYADQILQEVEEDLTRKSAETAFGEREIEPLGRPVLERGDDDALAEGKPYSFTLRYEIWPVIEPKNYKGQTVARSEEEVTTENVQEELHRLQEAHAFLVPVDDRGAEKDDQALVDVEGTDPVSGEALRHEGLAMNVDAENNLPEFNEALRGRRPGDAIPVEVTYPDDYHAESLRGKKVAYTLTMKELKRRQVPDLDDDLARDAGDFDNLAALRDAVRERLQAMRRIEADRVAKDRLLGKIADAHSFEVPEALVEAQVDTRLQDLVRHLLAQGIDPRREDIDWQKIREEQVGKAREEVKKMLLLDAIAEEEGLEVTAQEVTEQVEKAAKAGGETPQVFRSRLRKEGRLKAFENQLLREKCLDFVYDAANIS